MEPVLFETHGPVRILTLNRPEKRNALSLDLMRAVIERTEAVGRDPEARVLVIAAAGPAFSAGHDLREMAEAGPDLHAAREIFGVCMRMMQGLREIPQPVIAEVAGVATAAGCQLVASCDLAVCEEGVTFGTPGVRIGLFCTTPMVPLVRLIGRRRAMEMLLTGRSVSAQEALSWGLVNRVVPKGSLREEALRLAEEIARHSPFTIAFGKRAFYELADLDERSAYEGARERVAVNALAEDAREGMRAFIEKRPPLWRGR